MKVLSIGTDKDLFKKGTASFKRHQVYANYFEEFRIIVFARQQYGNNPVQIAENAWVYPTYAKSVFGLFFNAFKIGKNFLNVGENWVISAQDPFESGLVAYCLSRLTKTPFLVQIHGDFFSTDYWKNESLSNRFRWLVGRYILRRADAVRVVSDRVLKSLISLGVDDKKIIKTPVYTDIFQFNHAKPDSMILSLKTRGAVILSMARFSPEKNLELLLKAFAKIVATGESAHLVLVGTGKEENKLKNLTRQLFAEYKKIPVSFIPWTDNPAGLMKAADIYVLSSNYEGWGRVCIEALAAGTPLIMTEVGCAGEVVLNGKNGLVVPVGSQEALFEKIIVLIKDKILRQKLILNGYSTVEKLPKFEDNVRQYVRALRLCLTDKDNL